MSLLRELLRDLPEARVLGEQDVPVAGVAYDSRLVRPGDLFVALPGFHSNGAAFIPDALRRGAVAVVTQEPSVSVPEGVPLLLVPDARGALTNLSASFYGYPARRLRVVGVTGTDGKTTTVHLVSALLEAMGHRTGFITTVDVKVGDEILYNETQHTTPEPVEVQGLMRRMVDDGADYAVLESSSHALALDRLLHCEFDAAVFTNLSPEHLNFHGSMEGYLQAKARLFALLDQAMDKGVEKVAVLNADDPSSSRLRAATRARAIWYGIAGGMGGWGDGGPGGWWEGRSTQDSFVMARDVRLLAGGSRFTLVTPAGSTEVESRMAGRFNVYNWLAAAAVGLSQGASLEQIRRSMERVDSVPGRMQRVDAGQPFAVVVDFAHTPQALRTVLGTLRPITAGRLMVLFGLAGERDPGNRAEMGRIAATMADLGFFTMDDPRFEDPMEIAEEIAVGARAEGWREGRDFLKIVDREGAIREAFRRARPGDTVLLAGKGHERRQVIGADLVPWNDAEAARRVLAEMGY
jgi:UDP-N-acetylmuramoyl-L-alanyl-D-glutamate--2,6-diaminopimelate ligase